MQPTSPTTAAERAPRRRVVHGGAAVQATRTHQAEQPASIGHNRAAMKALSRRVLALCQDRDRMLESFAARAHAVADCASAPARGKEPHPRASAGVTRMQPRSVRAAAMVRLRFA